MIPDESEKRNDAIDLLIESYKDRKEVTNEDGTVSVENVFNPEIPWYQGHMVNQPFGRCALYLKRVEGLAGDAYDFMCGSRAVLIEKGLLKIVDAYKRSIDAKSSETWKDKDNTQSALIHILTKNKIEKQYTVKGTKSKTLSDAIMGRDANEDENN